MSFSKGKGIFLANRERSRKVRKYSMREEPANCATLIWPIYPTNHKVFININTPQCFFYYFWVSPCHVSENVAKCKVSCLLPTTPHSQVLLRGGGPIYPSVCLSVATADKRKCDVLHFGRRLTQVSIRIWRPQLEVSALMAIKTRWLPRTARPRRPSWPCSSLSPSSSWSSSTTSSPQCAAATATRGALIASSRRQSFKILLLPLPLLLHLQPELLLRHENASRFVAFK